MKKVSRSQKVLAIYRAKVKARKPNQVIKSGHHAFRVKDFTFKVKVRKKGKVQWKNVKPGVVTIPKRKVRIRRGENKGRLRTVAARERLSSRLSLPPRHGGRLRIFYKGKKVAETKLRKDAKSLTPKRLRKTLQQGEGISAPKIHGVEAVPVRAVYETWDPLLGQLPQAAWWLQDPGVFFNVPGDLRRKLSKFRVWFVVELPPETVSKSSLKMYGHKGPDDTDKEDKDLGRIHGADEDPDAEAPEEGELSVFYLTFFVIEIDRQTMLDAARTIKGGPLFSRRAEEHLEKHNEGDADHPWLSVRAFVGIEGLG